MVSLVSGTDSIGLVAHSEDLYFEAIEFYCSLGFVEIRSYAKQDATNDDSVHCSDSTREAWLVASDNESDESVTLKVRFIPDEHPCTKAQIAEGQDLRRHSGQLTLRCYNLQVGLYISPAFPFLLILIETH